MIRFQALGVRFSLPLLTLLFPPLALHLGMRGSFAGVVLALSVHELAHVLAAAALGVRITEIRLMPFGGSARMENPYGLPMHRLLLVAAAGPGINLLLGVFFAALAQWRILPASAAQQHVQANLVLGFFNLLPALPLDGGRMLYALLQRPLGQERAMLLGVWLGWALAALLLAGAAVGARIRGAWNLSFILAAVFIISSGRDERMALHRARALRLSALQQEDASPLPVHFYQVSPGTALRDALALLRPREHAWFILVQEGRPGRVIEDTRILRHILQNGAADISLGELHQS